MTIKIGETVKDEITGFQGVVVSRTEYLTGCARCFVQPKVDKDGKMPEGQWIDELSLAPVKGRARIDPAAFLTTAAAG